MPDNLTTTLPYITQLKSFTNSTRLVNACPPVHGHASHTVFRLQADYVAIPLAFQVSQTLCQSYLSPYSPIFSQIRVNKESFPIVLLPPEQSGASSIFFFNVIVLVCSSFPLHRNRMTSLYHPLNLPLTNLSPR